MAKKKKFTKKMAQKAHFKKRMEERFGVVVNRHDIRHLVEDIMKGDNVFYSRNLSARVSMHSMMFMGKRCNILYDKNRGVPVTVKPIDMEYVSYSGSTSKHGERRMFG